MSDVAPGRRLLRKIDRRRDHARGGAGKRGGAVVVVYGDYLCPYCRRLRAVLDRLRKALGERLTYVYRHFPNERVHPGAEFASIAAEAAARREFSEETGLAVEGDFTPLADRRLKSGKTVMCWLVEADLDLAGFCSNTFQMEWPRGSGRTITAPECDRAGYFRTGEALEKIIAYQRGFIEEAAARLAETVRP